MDFLKTRTELGLGALDLNLRLELEQTFWVLGLNWDRTQDYDLVPQNLRLELELHLDFFGTWTKLGLGSDICVQGLQDFNWYYTS